MFLAFFWGVGNLCIKTFSLKIMWLFHQSNYQNCYLSIKILINRIFILQAAISTLEINFSQSQPYIQDISFFPQYSYYVRRFFINNLSIYNFVNDLLIFFFNFFTRLRDFNWLIWLVFFPSFLILLKSFLFSYQKWLYIWQGLCLGKKAIVMLWSHNFNML